MNSYKNAHFILSFHLHLTLRELPLSARRHEEFYATSSEKSKLTRFCKNSHFRLLALLGSSSGVSSATANSCSSLASTVSQETHKHETEGLDSY